MKYSACIEWLFAAEAESHADRIPLAARAGLDAVEFWTWQNKDLDAITAALHETGMALTGFVAEPMIALTDPANREPFLSGLKASVETAQRLGAGLLIAQTGDDLDGRSRDAQRDAIIETLMRAGEVLADSGVRLGLEPLNTLIDHKGYFLPSTTEGLDIVDATGRPEIGIVYDLYHSAVMGERTEEVIGDRIGKVFHVHVADHPGRNEPGTGSVDLAQRVQTLVNKGYDGPIGLEFRPTRPSAETIDETRNRLG